MIFPYRNSQHITLFTSLPIYIINTGRSSVCLSVCLSAHPRGTLCGFLTDNLLPDGACGVFCMHVGCNPHAHIALKALCKLSKWISATKILHPTKSPQTMSGLHLTCLQTKTVRVVCILVYNSVQQRQNIPGDDLVNCASSATMPLSLICITICYTHQLWLWDWSKYDLMTLDQSD